MVAQGASVPRSAASAGANRARPVLLALLVVLLCAACGGRQSTKVKLPPPINPKIGWTQVGIASWYGPPYHGRRAANGEIYDMNKLTAAHKRLPFDSWLRVRNLSNGKTTQVRITDRGPFVGKRIIDLSKAAAEEIDMVASGIVRVRLTLIPPPGGSGRNATASSSSKPPNRRQSGRFDIQIGLFERRDNATALANKARKKGHRVTVQESGNGGSPSFRVLVAGGRARQAESRMQRLRRQGFDGFLRARRD